MDILGNPRLGTWPRLGTISEKFDSPILKCKICQQTKFEPDADSNLHI